MVDLRLKPSKYQPSPSLIRVRPARDAACLFSRLPSSGMVAMSWLAVSVPTPAMLVRI